MDIDLPYYLFWASVISGAIWAVDAWFFKPSRLAKANSSGAVAEPVLVEYARSFFPIFVAVLLRSFVLPSPIRFLRSPWCLPWKLGTLYWSTSTPTV